ncbi:MAG: hypothetical protein HYX80_07415 [Chloroflexi bacterium]|nr:hypothetical protein [Chloroflexota bacterium]
MSKSPLLIVITSFLVFTLSAVSCSIPNNSMISDKVSGQLLAQIDLRKAQLDNPTADRLRTMKEMGMNVDTLEIQRIFIHLISKPTLSQIEEIKALGITLYPDSWIPPVGDHPTGYLLADMPVDKLPELTQKDYVVRLETAERRLEPQNGFQLQ